MASINQLDGLVLDKRTDISIFLGARRKVLAYRWLVGERNERMPRGSSRMMIYFILMRMVERAGCYRMLESCEGLKNLPRRRRGRGYEGLLSKTVQSWHGAPYVCSGSRCFGSTLHSSSIQSPGVGSGDMTYLRFGGSSSGR